jgi:hypothetical protein
MYLKSSANLLQNVNDDDNNLEYENKSDVFTMSCLLSKAHNIFYSYKIMIMSEWVSEWLLFNTNSAIFQLYHCENKLMMMRSTLY